ncbi:conjugal transfer protein TrbD [Aliarcobacter butzleri]|uniref:Conjugal transfer protein TrbD n=1 Tax=Aliarcobacter butzleri TaxID=28197 RepID=A0AAW7PUM7_9BACT|nr:conjugal transfer protein TrbD [Aliarcobacter butzleri]MDN5069410.1 conjugal transfer protein TrbD [Aliarcobacter butzleri]
MTQNKDTLLRADFYSALNKPNLIFGADRELILMTGVISFGLFFTGLTWITTITAIFLFLVNGFFLRLMAKADPLMRYIFIRQVKYKKFYFARSTPFAE